MQIKSEISFARLQTGTRLVSFSRRYLSQAVEFNNAGVVLIISHLNVKHGKKKMLHEELRADKKKFELVASSESEFMFLFAAIFSRRDGRKTFARCCFDTRRVRCVG